MHIEDLTREYSAKSDEELLRLAGESEELTETAQLALAGELAKRRINVAEHLRFLHDEGPERKVEQTEARETLPPRDSPKVSQFVAQVLEFYHNHFWLFVRLISPAVIIGYLAVLTALHEGREIASHLPHGKAVVINHKTELLQIFFVKQFGFLVSWLAFSSSFGAICSAVRQIGEGVIPFDSFAAVRARIGPFLRLSLALYFIMLLLFGTALTALGIGFLWILGFRHFHPSSFATGVVSYVSMGLLLLLLSRFGLSIPALVLDNYGVAGSIFRSDELTEGTWSILAALLAKSVVGGYLVGMLPFWIASCIPARTLLPSWFPWLLDAASVAGVIVVEPTMFIGFALLYTKMSAPQPDRAAGR